MNLEDMSRDKLESLIRNAQKEIDKRNGSKDIQLIKICMGMAEYYFVMEDLEVAFKLMMKLLKEHKQMIIKYDNFVNLSINYIIRKEDDANILLKKTEEELKQNDR